MERNELYIANYHVLLMEYAAGTLDRAQSMVVAAHVNMSPQAREIVHSCETIGGALIEKQCEPVAMNQGSLDHVLQCIEHKHMEQQRRCEDMRRQSVFPEDLHGMPECIETRITCKPGTRLKWKRVQSGIHTLAIPVECRRSKARVFRMDPGAATPVHSHQSLEITLVIDGGYEDETGHYQRGDLAIVDTETPAHSPHACTKKGCTYVSVSSAPIRYVHPLEAMLHAFKRYSFYLPVLAGTGELFLDGILFTVA